MRVDLSQLPGKPANVLPSTQLRIEINTDLLCSLTKMVCIMVRIWWEGKRSQLMMVITHHVFVAPDIPSEETEHIFVRSQATFVGLLQLKLSLVMLECWNAGYIEHLYGGHNW